MRKFLFSALFLGAMALVAAPASHATPTDVPHGNFASLFQMGSGSQFGSGDAGHMNHTFILNMDEVNFVSNDTPTAPTPEPASLLLLGTGLLGAGAWIRRSRMSS